MAPTINVLITSFPGLGLPPTLCLPTSSNATISSLATRLTDALPDNLSGRLRLSTTSGHAINPTSTARISTLLSNSNDHHVIPDVNTDILSLRLSCPLLGGKGGFGSQLRAAGGRMSSRKKKNQGDPNASSRNLDGRRLRTVAEAKALAEYLAVKPEMDRKEKEERRRRWEQVVEAAERREEEVRSGAGTGHGKARVDGKWIEGKEEAEGKMREGIERAMREGLLRGGVVKGVDVGGEVEEDGEEGAESASGDEDMAEEGGSASSKGTTPPSETEAKAVQAPRKVFGWDDEDDEVSDSDVDEEAPSK